LFRNIKNYPVYFFITLKGFVHNTFGIQRLLYDEPLVKKFVRFLIVFLYKINSIGLRTKKWAIVYKGFGNNQVRRKIYSYKKAKKFRNIFFQYILFFQFNIKTITEIKGRAYNGCKLAKPRRKKKTVPLRIALNL